jgi:hypothetical protein
MQNNLGKTLTYSDLVTDFAMGGPDEGDGIINLGAMIAGGTNFKLMYNILERLRVNVTSAVSSISYDAEIGDPMFAYNNLASYRLVINSRATVLDYNMAIDSTNLLRSAPTANNNSITPIPVLTPLFCEGSELIKRWEIEDAIYYFIPSAGTTSSFVWIGLGVKSNCWSQDNLDRWIIGKRVQINRMYNYIFKVVRKESQSGNINLNAANYIWSYYEYYNTGSYKSKTDIVMNNYTNDGYFVPGSTVNTNSVYNRLSGNYYDILRGFKTYNLDVNNANRHCTCLYSPTRGTNGTSTTISSAITNLHAAPHRYLKGSTVNAFWEGMNRRFGVYRHIVNINLTNVDKELALSAIPNLILYPGIIYATQIEGLNLTSGYTHDLNTKLGGNTNITKINQFNSNITKVSPITQSDGGRIMYIIPYTLSAPMSVYVNAPKSTTPYWNCPIAGRPDAFLSKLGELSSGNTYIIECWTEELAPNESYAKMYTYSTLTGECRGVSNTISCKYTTT